MGAPTRPPRPGDHAHQKGWGRGGRKGGGGRDTASAAPKTRRSTPPHGDQWQPPRRRSCADTAGQQRKSNRKSRPQKRRVGSPRSRHQTDSGRGEGASRLSDATRTRVCLVAPEPSSMHNGQALRSCMPCAHQRERQQKFFSTTELISCLTIDSSFLTRRQCTFHGVIVSRRRGTMKDAALVLLLVIFKVKLPVVIQRRLIIGWITTAAPTIG